MAGDWVVWVKGLSRKREVLAIAERTGRDRRLVACLLMEFWEWADGETADGELRPLSVRNLSAICPDTDDEFWLAVVAVGWLEVEEGVVIIPKFDRWMGDLTKRKLTDAKRKRRSRSHADGEERPTSVRNLSAKCPSANGHLSEKCPQNVQGTSADGDGQGGSPLPLSPVSPPPKPPSPFPPDPIPGEDSNGGFTGGSDKGQEEKSPDFFAPKRFIPPTAEQVAAYCRERGNGVDASAFVSFYESKGWMIGKNRMKDWRAAVRTWERNESSFSRNGDGHRKKPVPSLRDLIGDIADRK